jgi:adenine-specific DNA-methyltransferase
MSPRRAGSQQAKPDTASGVVEAVQHKDKRLNIPTEEQRDFVADEEREPTSVHYDRPLLYPRDPDRDPQLVWRGKDALDEGPLSVPAVPLYIQEKIDPSALVESLRSFTGADADETQPSMFSDFDGLDGYEQVEFYEHAANWSNRLILGDALLAMNSLAEKENLKGQVQMVYMDPPYGIEFRSNWQVSTRKRDVKDGRDASRQPEQVKAFRDTWAGGIHSYLNYLRDRLVLAHELLTDSGSIFVQIGEENVHLVRSLLDEVFGSENFITTIWFKKKKMPLGETFLFTPGDYILWFAKERSKAAGKFRRLYIDKNRDDPSFNYVELADGERMSMANYEQSGRTAPYRRFQSMDLRSSGRTESWGLPGGLEGWAFMPGGGGCWEANEEGMKRLIDQKRLFAPGDTLRYVLYLDDYPVSELSNVWSDTQGANSPVYVVQTANRIVERCMLMTTDPGDLVIDPTCGSGTTAIVAEQWGRRWITVDTSRVAVALARTRLMSAVYPYYLLADTEAGANKQAGAF